MKRQLLLFAILLFTGLVVQAQCNGRGAAVLDGNQVRAQLYNSADRFWDLVGNPAYEVPAGSGKHVGFTNALWMGGLDQSGQLHISAQTYRQAGIDYGSGPYRTGGNYDCGTSFSSTTTGLVFPLVPVSNGAALDFRANAFDLLDPATGSIQGGTLLNLRQQFNALELGNGKVMVVGERASVSTPTPAFPFEFVDLNTLTSAPGITLNSWHGKSSLTPLNANEILIAGVIGCEIYDVLGQSSTTVASMNAPRHYHDAVAIGPNKVLVGPGTAQLNGNNSLGVFTYEVYDNGAWTTVAGSPVMRDRTTQLTPLANGNILITGGSSDVVEVYDSTTQTISTYQTLPFSIGIHSVLPLGNDQYAIVSSNATTTAEFVNADNFIYDFANQSLTYGPTRGYTGKAVVLANGQFLAGDNSDSYIVMNNDLSIRNSRWSKIWKVNQSEIDQFLADYANNSVDFTQYPDIETWPGNGDVAKGEDYYLAPFIDVDGDGIYDPAGDGDYPCITGTQALWWVYNDDVVPNLETGGNPLGVQVKVLAYAVDCQQINCPDTFLDYVTFYEYEISNKSGNAYTDMYVANWFDSDIGNFADDYVGCDSIRNLAFAYNGDPDDENQAGYGLNPPAMGSVVLESPDNIGMTNFMYYENDFSVKGNPEQPIHYYYLMQNRWKDGQKTTFGFDGRVMGTDSTNFMYTGDPGFCGGTGTGWSEVSALNTPFDRRYVQGIGPFSLQAGETVKVSYGFIYARGFYNDNLGSVCELKEASDSTVSWFNQQSSCSDIVLGVDEVEREDLSGQVYPNPNAGIFKVELEQALDADGEMQILDLYGRIVHRQVVKAGDLQVDVNVTLPSAVYLVQIDTPSGKFLRKINVQ